MLGSLGNSGVCQSIKHRYTQTSALVLTKTLVLVLLIRVRCVSSLGLPEFAVVLLGLRNSSVPNGAGIQDVLGTSELTSPLDSLLSCVYNVQQILDSVNNFYAILRFS